MFLIFYLTKAYPTAPSSTLSLTSVSWSLLHALLLRLFLFFFVYIQSIEPKMPKSDEAKRRTFIAPLTLEHILLTELINAPSPVTPQPPRSFVSTLNDGPDLRKHPEISKKRMAITELVNDDLVSEPAAKRQKFFDDEPVTPSAVLVQPLLSTREAFSDKSPQPSVGAGLQTLAALATTSTGSDRGENKENEHKNDDNDGNNAFTGVKDHNQDNIYNTNTLQTTNFAHQPNSLSSSSPPLLSPSQQDRKYICQICNFRFHQAGGLRNHTRAVHLKEKPYGCAWPGCLRFGERGFAARGDLTRHVSSVHKGERNFRCDRCTMRFARRSVLIRHVRNIHGTGKR